MRIVLKMLEIFHFTEDDEQYQYLGTISFPTTTLVMKD